MKYNGRYIGTNHANGTYFGAINSSYDGVFNEEEVLVGNGLGDIIPCVIGDISDIYPILEQKMKERMPEDFESLCACVFATIQEYFGDYRNVSSRMDNYVDLDYIESFEDIGKVSNLKGKNAAACVERAMVAQNLLKFLKINTFYKSSGIINDGKKEVHSYNLVEHNGRCYIFDATMPSLLNNEINPLIAEIPKEVFDMISSPLHRVGYSVEVKYYNPLRNMEKDVIYDSAREKLLVVDNSSVKKTQ